MKASRKLLLAGVALIVPVMTAPAASAADLPILASPDSWGGWYVDHSSMEFGGQVFIDKPGTSRSDNRAKFEEYGNRTDPLFLNFIDLGLATRDGHYTAEIYGKNIGVNNQDLRVDLAQPGEQYLTLGWYQTPHLRSTTAQTLFGGVGTNALTVDPTVQAALNLATSTAGVTANAGNSHLVQNQILGGAAYQPLGCYLVGQVNPCPAGAVPVATTIAGAEHGVTLGLQRDRKEVEYRWTPSPDWDVKVDYSNEHRWGVQEQGFLFSSSTSTPMAQVAAPVDDTTQDASISGEYSGYSPWGQRWNGILRYDTSIFTDRYSAFTAQNPFGGPLWNGTDYGTQTCPVATATTVNNCYGIGQEGTAPNNGANSIMATVGIDLPWFKSSRYMGTFEYNMMTQNAPFIPMNPFNVGSPGLPAGSFYTTSNPLGTVVALAPMPRNSLNGEIDTTLFNNVLTTQFTSDLKNKLSYRYYSDNNNTPALTLQNWLVNDAALAAATGVASGGYAPHTTLFSSYTKQNASDELTWKPVKWADVGISSGWEQFQYSMYAANITNEYTQKVFGDVTPTDWLTVRASDAVSWRRYDNYNWQAYLGNEMLTSANINANMSENPLLRDVNIANRNRNLANLYVDITTPIQGLSITPTAGLRWDDYPNDPNLLSQGETQLGLRNDHNWNAGLEANYAINSSTTLTASYMREQTNQNIISNSVGASTSLTGCNPPTNVTALACDINMYSSAMSEGVNTWMVAANFQLIPDRLQLKVSFTHENGTDVWNTGPYGTNCSGSSCQGGVNIVGLPQGLASPAYPSESTTFDRVDATLTYKVDPAILTQFGSKGEAFLKLHYLFEENRVTNWQNDATQVYMYAITNSTTTAFKDMIFMAGDNPNYTAQALMASLVLKW